MAAFADPSVGAILATIGGDDQITVLRHLDADVVREHPRGSSVTATTRTC
jgi:muramoyltetrapeptide carboxypeptidase LdcA involved in peptidoglycan recycling